MDHAGHGAHHHARAHYTPAAGHDRHAGHSVAMFRDRFWISVLLTLPTLVWGHMLQDALGYNAPAFPGSRWIPTLFGTAVFVYGGTPFLRAALPSVAERAAAHAGHRPSDAVDTFAVLREWKNGFA